ncbi:MAG: tyrosine-type recombinase/integrase [Candidatus Binataceae bacterium]
MSIKRSHRGECTGGSDCACPWLLDYRPQGLAGPRHRVEFPTKKAAERHQAETRVKVGRREYIAPDQIPTFGKAASEWLRGKSDHHPASLQGWRVHLRHLAKLNNLRLDRIDIAMVERVRDELRANLSPQTVSAILTTCTAVLKLAQRRGWASSNPAALAERPRRAVTELAGDEDSPDDRGLRAVRPDEVLNIDQIRCLLEHTDPGLWRTLFATVAATGLRTEEAYSLQWSDLELDAGRLFVRRSLSWSRGVQEHGKVRPKFYQPKTLAGYRTLPLPAPLTTALKAWKLQSPASSHDLVFCRADGEPLHRSNVLRQGLYPALRRAGLRGANIKTLRHSFASGLILAGAPITEVQHRLGHSNPAVTLKVYSHWFRDADTGAGERFAAGFLGELEKSGQKVGTKTESAITPVRRFAKRVRI